MQEIFKELERYGADPISSEAAHVLRLAGTTNTKTGDVAKIVDGGYNFNPTRYTLDSLSKAWLPELKYSKEEMDKIEAKKKKSKKEKSARKTKSLFNIHSLNFARMQDIQTLIEIRDGECKGYREKMLFLYRYWGNCFFKDQDKALSECLELNKMFKEPLSENEVISATKRAVIASEIWEEKLAEYWALEKKPSVRNFFKNTGCYVYSNKTLILELAIEQDEMPHMKTIFNTKEKNRRNKDYRAEWSRNNRKNENGLNSREQAKMDKIKVILELQEKGFNQSAIANELGVTRQAVSKLVKEIKENNLIKSELIEQAAIENVLDKVTDNELKLLAM